MRSFASKFLMIAVIFSLVFGLVSCSQIIDKILGNTPEQPDDGTTDGGDTWSNNDFVLIENKVAKFQLVYTSESGSIGKKCTEDLVKQLRDFGVTVSDPIAENNAALVSECEIIIGTGAKYRGEELSVTQKELGKEGYLGKIVGKKILIAGGTQDLTKSLFDRFVKDEMGITKKTEEITSIAIKADYHQLKETQYKINTISIADIDLDNFTLVYDIENLSEADQKIFQQFRDDLYEISGYWLNLGDKSLLDTYEHSFVIKTTDDAGDNGFRAFYDGKNFNIECAYANVFTEGFEILTDKIIFNSTKKDIAISENYTYQDYDAAYKSALKCVDERSLLTLNDTIDRVRRGSGASLYGAPASALLCMPDDMVTADDIALANQAIVKICNYLHDEDTLANDTSGGQGEIDFVAIRIVRLLFVDKAKLNASTESALNKFFLEDDFESIHKSENHMLMFRVSRYLAACAYEGETFTQYGMSAEEIKKIDHDYLISYMQHRARQGWAEFDSIGYAEHDFHTLITLYEYAEDYDIRTLAEMLMETMLLSVIANTTENGIYGGAHGRGYAYVITGLDTGIYYVNALYFGLGDFYNTDFEINLAAEPGIMLSSWRPDKSLYTVYQEKVYPFISYEKVHNHTLDYTPQEMGYINKYTYNTSLYSIGCINKQDSFPEGNSLSWYEEHQQTNWSLGFAENPDAGITVHHPAETGLHAYWYGDQDCCCNHLFGNENIVIGIYYIPGQTGLKDSSGNIKSYSFIHANVNKAQFDEIIEDPDNNRLFVRLGDAYAALTFSHSYQWGGKDPESEIVIYDGDKTSDIRIAFACEAGDKATNGSFEEFINSVKAKTFSFEADNLYLTYGNMSYNVVTNVNSPDQVIGEMQYIDGVLVDSNYGYTYNSPFMKSVFDSGVIEIYYDGKVRTLDFINIRETIRDQE